MTSFTKIPQVIEDAVEKSNTTTSRRDFIKNSGLLVVSFSTASVVSSGALGAVTAQVTSGQAGPYPDLDFRQLDSWIALREDNTATFYVGKTDLGQGTGTAFRQIMSDELDIAYDRINRQSGWVGWFGCPAA